MALFTQRARRLRQDFALDDRTGRLVEEVCRSLDGLPLAIELAAARVRSLPVEEIARRLDDRFALLRDPSSHEPARRRALEAALDWSYDLLFPDDQRGLWALVVLPRRRHARRGGAGAGRARRARPPSVLDTVTRLVDRSLVKLDAAARAGGRATGCSTASAPTPPPACARRGCADAAAAAHATWYAERADWCAEHVRSADQPGCLAFARAERADVDAALQWCHDHDRATGARIALGLGWTWVVLGDGSTGAARVRYGVGRGRPRPSTGSARACSRPGSRPPPVTWSSPVPTSTRPARSATALDDEVLAADVERHRAFLAIQEGRPADVLAAAARRWSTYRARRGGWSDGGGAAAGGVRLAHGRRRRHRPPRRHRGRDPAERDRRLVGDGARPGDPRRRRRGGGTFRRRRRGVRGGRRVGRRLGFPGQAALHRASFARALAEAGDPSAAAAYDVAQREAAAVADGRLGATVRFHRARLRLLADDVDAARALLEENDRWYAAAGGGDLADLNRETLASLRAPARPRSAVTRCLAPHQRRDRRARLTSMTTHRRPARQAATLEEVAARAGVSRATASRVLRGSSNVSDHAREAVGLRPRRRSTTPPTSRPAPW